MTAADHRPRHGVQAAVRTRHGHLRGTVTGHGACFLGIPYGLGREPQEIIPYVPIGSTLRIGVSIMTYRDALSIGVTGDETAQDLDVLTREIETELASLARGSD